MPIHLCFVNGWCHAIKAKPGLACNAYRALQSDPLQKKCVDPCIGEMQSTQNPKDLQLPSLPFSTLFPFLRLIKIWRFFKGKIYTKTESKG